jgi:hypothetical protein
MPCKGSRNNKKAIAPSEFVGISLKLKSSSRISGLRRKRHFVILDELRWTQSAVGYRISRHVTTSKLDRLKRSSVQPALPFNLVQKVKQSGFSEPGYY